MDISRRQLARGGEILLLTPGWTSLVIFRRVGEDSLTHPMLDISHHRSARGGEILLLTPGWTSLVIVRRMVGRFSYSPQAGHIT